MTGGAAAKPAALLTVEKTFEPPWNVPLGPDAGAENVTATPGDG